MDYPYDPSRDPEEIEAQYEPKPNYYSVTPAEVRYSKELSLGAKILYGELTALSHKEGYSWATNRYFAELYDTCAKTISRWISSLAEAGFIRVELLLENQQQRRRIWISRGVDKNVPTPPDKNVPYNNTSINKEYPPNPQKGARPKPRKKIPEEKKEVLPNVWLSSSQIEDIVQTSGSEAMAELCYVELRRWKLNKGIQGGANDYKAIVDWVIPKVKEKNPSGASGIAKGVTPDEDLVKKIESKFPKLVGSSIKTGYNYIEFDMGMHSPHLKFGENGFREQVLNNLRKMNLPIEGL